MIKLNEKGFTLVELIVTVSILLTLSTIAVISISGVLTKSNDNINTIQEKMLKETFKSCILDGECVCNSFCTMTPKELANKGYLEGENISDIEDKIYAISIADNGKTTITDEGATNFIGNSSVESGTWTYEDGKLIGTSTEDGDGTNPIASLNYYVSAEIDNEIYYKISTECTKNGDLFSVSRKDDLGNSVEIKITNLGTNETLKVTSDNIEDGKYKLNFKMYNKECPLIIEKVLKN